MDEIWTNKQQTKIWQPVEFKYIVYNVWDWKYTKIKQITDEETMD